MSNRNIVKQQAIAESASTDVRLPKSIQRMEQARGRHHIKAAVEAASQYGVDPAAEQVAALSWDQAVLEASHEQLSTTASEHYGAVTDRYYNLLTQYSNTKAIINVFGDTAEVPAKYNWNHLVDRDHYRNEGGLDPLYTDPQLLGYETREAANTWREQMSMLYDIVTSTVWGHLQGERDMELGLKIAPRILTDDGGTTYGPYTNVAVLFEFKGKHCEAFTTLDDSIKASRLDINRVDIGTEEWTEAEQAVRMSRYKIIREHHGQADSLLAKEGVKIRQQKQADRMAELAAEQPEWVH